MVEFTPFAKVARLNRDITITEKIDGTNGAIVITDDELLANWETGQFMGDGITVNVDGKAWLVYAQSRKRIITPKMDNHGFAKWVWDNSEKLAHILGPGVHFGEWWGHGIQRGYGQEIKRFSLFNTSRWNDETLGKQEGWLLEPIGLGVVPVLYEGPFNREDILPPWDDALGDLRMFGSVASPGFMRPEGVVIYHHAANTMFKITLENDEVPKEVLRRQAQEKVT
jgi:hypothetical protein